MTPRPHRPLALVLVLAAAFVTLDINDAFAQRPALTRDVDNPAFAPVRIAISFSVPPGEGFQRVDSITVPAGKRLVIENASIWGLTTSPDVVTGLWLSPKNVSMFHMLDPAANEAESFSFGATNIAYNRVIKAYFEAGETLQGWLYTEGGAGQKLVNLYLQGYYVTLP